MSSKVTIGAQPKRVVESRIVTITLGITLNIGFTVLAR
jgi:hypothetical protein